MVVDGMAQSLLAAEVAFRGLHRNVAQQELDLFEFPSCFMAQPCAAPPAVVGREWLNPATLGAGLHDVPDDFLRDVATPRHAEPAD